MAEISDSFWMRYGISSISPGYLAYLAEACPAGGPWPQNLPEGQGHAFVLSSVHAPCYGTQSDPVDPVLGAEKACAVLGDNDPIAAGRLAEEYLTTSGTMHWVHSTEVSHSSVEGTDECLELVL
ncbi:hypothetical protein [Nocardiopsis sp. B62]|uniref:hypothetical protein n=1 Tax=Nocardiopsis sp. B62 TaxID=2824874 RepID=UPI001B396B21|nr:hypothetical protein [Nocardiopsis sp. B62]MBQ1081065.1 hypothetical protein [Nocardiopsis sp. B62]